MAFQCLVFNILQMQQIYQMQLKWIWWTQIIYTCICPHELNTGPSTVSAMNKLKSLRCICSNVISNSKHNNCWFYTNTCTCTNNEMNSHTFTTSLVRLGSALMKLSKTLKSSNALISSTLSTHGKATMDSSNSCRRCKLTLPIEQNINIIKTEKGFCWTT